jgi:flagellar biosynthesis/type III secretory pathway chaperone
VVQTADSSTARRRIVEVTGTAVFHALGLADALADEKRALESQDMDALDVAISNKSKCVAELRLVEDQRKRICTDCGFGDKTKQMQQMIAWCDEYAIVANCWQHLMEVVANCDLLNTTNGAIIRSRKQQVDSSISILRNGQPALTVYNRDGQKPQQHGLRSIAQA